MRDPFAVRGGKAFPTQHLAAGTELLAGANAIGRNFPELHLAAFSGKSQQRLAIGHAAGIAVASGLVLSYVHEPARFRGKNEHASARSGNNTASIMGEIDASGLAHSRLDPVYAQ